MILNKFMLHRSKHTATNLGVWLNAEHDNICLRTHQRPACP
jgi:hypothetical protein